jgi:hypothetical protein
MTKLPPLKSRRRRQPMQPTEKLVPQVERTSQAATPIVDPPVEFLWDPRRPAARRPKHARHSAHLHNAKNTALRRWQIEESVSGTHCPSTTCCETYLTVSVCGQTGQCRACCAV